MRIVAFRGRIGRRTFFAATMLLYGLLFAFVLILVVGAANADLDLPAKDIPSSLRAIKMPAPIGWICGIVGLFGILYVVLGSIAISVRRLHDFGLTGFFVLLYPALLSVIPATHWPDGVPGPADLLWTLIMIAQPGTRGPNAFGEDPRAAVALEPASSLLRASTDAGDRSE